MFVYFSVCTALVNCCTRCCFKVFDDSEMVNQMMSQPVVSTEMIDDDELRQELDDLLAAKVDTSVPVQPPTADRFGKHRLMIFRYCSCYCHGCCLYSTFGMPTAVSGHITFLVHCNICLGSKRSIQHGKYDVTSWLLNWLYM